MNWNTVILVALKILAVLVLVLLNGFFVAAEFALVRIRETQLDVLVAKGRRRAKMARHIVRHLNSYLSATQLGITMVSLGLGYLGEPVFASLLTPVLDWMGVDSATLVTTVSRCGRFQRVDLFECRGGRARAQMADDSEDVIRRALVGASVALVLPRVLSIQPAAESLGAGACALAGI